MDLICPKRIFPVKNGKSEHHRWILHIQISLGTKFQLKLIILIFWSKFPQKKVFPVEKSQRTSIVVIYYIKLFREGTDRHNGILISLLLLVGETKKSVFRTEFHIKHTSHLKTITLHLLLSVFFHQQLFLQMVEVYPGLPQASKLECFIKIVKGFNH